MRKRKLEFGSKADTLKALEGLLSEAIVLPQVSFTRAEWRLAKENCWNRVNEKLTQPVIVRSSAKGEDSAEHSQAGAFLSVPDVSGKAAFDETVGRVFASYEKREDQASLSNVETMGQDQRTGYSAPGECGDEDQVLVQPMLHDVMISGVAFTMDPNTLGHYDVINYDRSGSTSSVTSGERGETCLYYHFKDSEVPGEETELTRLFHTLRELEKLFGQENLDVEFAFDRQGKLYVLQVRPLILKAGGIDRKTQKEELDRIRAGIKREQKRKPFLYGEQAIYSVMTDWNPAEMIGVRPKRLALSLYKEIITDSVWAYQRDNYGYKNLRSFPLMMDFGGLPYIDVRVSFNSFVPAGLDDTLSEKLVDYYLKRLRENPLEHDKVEFDIVFSCYTFDLMDRLEELSSYGFSDMEIRRIADALREVTNRIIDHKTGLWRNDYAKLKILSERYETIRESTMTRIEKIYWLLEDCKRYGTLPFAGLARAAFVAVQILKSMVVCGIIEARDYEEFMNGVETVGSMMKRDIGELSRSAFLKKYGHLRPGTYDVTSLRYDEASDLYFGDQLTEAEEECDDHPVREFRMSLAQMEKLRSELEKNQLTNDILELMDFIKCVIEAREYGKFMFTRNLSEAIRLIASVGEECGLSKEDTAHLDIRVISELYASCKDVAVVLRESVEKGKKEYRVTETITLPPVIVSPEDVQSFAYPDSEPNYITSLSCRAKVVFPDQGAPADTLTGGIVLIESADPGYDWIFSHHPAGLITMYGGANSHMAIRAGELGIPAAIGVGQKRYEVYEEAEILEINAADKKVQVIR